MIFVSVYLSVYPFGNQHVRIYIHDLSRKYISAFGDVKVSIPLIGFQVICWAIHSDAFLFCLLFVSLVNNIVLYHHLLHLHRLPSPWPILHMNSLNHSCHLYLYNTLFFFYLFCDIYFILTYVDLVLPDSCRLLCISQIFLSTYLRYPWDLIVHATQISLFLSKWQDATRLLYRSALDFLYFFIPILPLTFLPCTALFCTSPV